MEKNLEVINEGNINEERNYTVYMHTSPSGKRYIGITRQSVEERWKNGWGYYTQLIFYRAIKKYSFENFKHEIIKENLSREEAMQLEKDLIKEYKTTDRKFGYNITEGGECVSPNAIRKGYHLTEEAKLKISLANKGKKRPDNIERFKGNSYTSKTVYQYALDGKFISLFSSTREVERRLGIVHNEISNCCQNKIFAVLGYCWSYLSPDLFSIETKRKEVEDYLNDKILNNQKNVSVIQYDYDTLNIVNEYNSIVEASVFTNIHKSAISNCVSGIAKTAGGYIWRYSFEEPTDEYVNWCKSRHDSKKKSVYQYTIDGELINRYNSITDASKLSGVSISSIANCCKCRTKTAGGYIWRYADGEEDESITRKAV